MKLSFLTSPLVICSAFALAASFASAAHADQLPATKDFSFKFDFQQTDLNSQAGAQKVLTRLEREVRRQCGAYERHSISEQPRIDACIGQTMSKTVNRFGSSTMTSLYQSRAAG